MTSLMRTKTSIVVLALGTLKVGSCNSMPGALIATAATVGVEFLMSAMLFVFFENLDFTYA